MHKLTVSKAYELHDMGIVRLAYVSCGLFDIGQ